jgi:hypothetical protein
MVSVAAFHEALSSSLFFSSCPAWDVEVPIEGSLLLAASVMAECTAIGDFCSVGLFSAAGLSL